MQHEGARDGPKKHEFSFGSASWTQFLKFVAHTCGAKAQSEEDELTAKARWKLDLDRPFTKTGYICQNFSLRGSKTSYTRTLDLTL